MDRSAERDRDENRVGVRHVVGQEKNRPRAGDLLNSVEPDLEIQPRKAPYEWPGEFQEDLKHFDYHVTTEATEQRLWSLDTAPSSGYYVAL